MNELGETESFSSQKKGGLSKGVIVNIVFVSIAVLVVGIASSIFFGGFSEGRLKTSNPKNGTFSNFQGEEQYYDGEENWNLDYVDDVDDEVQEIKEASYDDLKNGFMTKISEGGALYFDYDGENHEMSIDSINDDSVEIIMRSGRVIFSSISLNDYEVFDFDGDFVYDLKVSLLEVGTGEAIFNILAVSEEYQPEAEDIPENVSDFAIFSTEFVPYSCEEKDGYVDYSFLIISKADDKVYSEKKKDSVVNDVCVGSGDFYKKYYCEDKDFNSTYVYCNSRFESCIDATCVKTKYERSLLSPNNAEQDYTGFSECLVKLESQTFWFSSSVTECENIYLASSVLSRDSFVDYMNFVGLYDQVFRAYYSEPDELEFYYLNSDGEPVDLSYIEGLIDSSDCESFNFLGLDTYCLNSISGVKNNNLEYFLYLIKFFSDSDYNYGSSFITGNTFDFLKAKVSAYVDASDPGLVPNSGCVAGDYSNYNNNFYICGDAIGGYGEDGNQANVVADVFLDILDSLSGYSSEECFDVVIDESYEITYYGDYEGDLESEDRPYDGYCGETLGMVSCTCSPEPNAINTCYSATCEGCRAHDMLIEGHETYEFLDMNSLLGEKINFLYKMSKNYQMSFSDRAVFNSRIEDYINSISCANGIYDQYVDFSGEEIISPEILPDKYIIP